jgi:hypothetical protein
VNIIDEDLRAKSFIMLGKKKHGESIDILMNEDKKDSNKMETDNKLINEQMFDSAKKSQRNKYYDELEPNLKVMDYIYTREKRSLNRNTILRPFNYSVGFDNLLSLTKRIFFTSHTKDQIKTERVSFLDEIVSGESLRENKAIIIVPAAFYPGNICIDNAKEFFVNGK